jgi:hypothetical protein
MRLKASLSLVRQRTDQIDAFTTETSCLGCHAGYPPATHSSQLNAQHGLLVVYQQPAEKGGSGGGAVFCLPGYLKRDTSIGTEGFPIY